MLLLNFSQHPINLELLPEEAMLLSVPTTLGYDQLVELIENSHGVLVNYYSDEDHKLIRSLALKRNKLVYYVGA